MFMRFDIRQWYMVHGTWYMNLVVAAIAVVVAAIAIVVVAAIAVVVVAAIAVVVAAIAAVVCNFAICAAMTGLGLRWYMNLVVAVVGAAIFFYSNSFGSYCCC